MSSNGKEEKVDKIAFLKFMTQVFNGFLTIYGLQFQFSQESRETESREIFITTSINRSFVAKQNQIKNSHKPFWKSVKMYI